MYLLRVIPIVKGIPKESLSYYSAEKYSAGDLVDVPVRRGFAPALIISSEEALLEKAEIKSLPFTLRKLGKTASAKLLSIQFLESVRTISEHHACQVGSTLMALTPKHLYTERDKLKSMNEADKPTLPGETLVFQADDETRFAHYKSLIREAFAYRRSIMITVPTIAEGHILFRYLEKGIEQYAHFIHGGINKKEFVHIWNEVAEATHPLLVVCTPIFFCLPRTWHTIIVERESSRNYKMQQRPFIDLRTFAERYAKFTGSACILSDNLLRTETLNRLEKYELQELSPVKWRSLVTADISLVDMRKYNKEKKEFRLLSDELIELIKKTKSDSSHLFLYTARRGISPHTVCRDCGTTVCCTRCKAPVVLHSSVRPGEKEIRYFLCHRCGEKRDASELCKRCGSWNLIPLGIGSEGVEEYLKQEFPDVEVFRIDSDTASTDKKAREIVERFYDTPGSIALGTDRALGALDRQVEYASIVSIDSFFSLPDFRINEKIFHTVLRMRALANHSFLAQTREADNPLWEEAIKGNLIDFYRREIKEREILRYPPFVMLIKISYSGTPTLVRSEMQKLKTYFAPREVSIFPAFIENAQGRFAMHALLRLERAEWPNPELLEKLRNLPPAYTVNVDPENLL